MGKLQRQAGDVAARSCRARDSAGAERVSCDGEDNRNDRRRLLCRFYCASLRDNDIDVESDEFLGDLDVSVAVPFPPAILDLDGAALNPAELAEPLNKSIDPSA